MRTLRLIPLLLALAVPATAQPPFPDITSVDATVRGYSLISYDDPDDPIAQQRAITIGTLLGAAGALTADVESGLEISGNNIHIAFSRLRAYTDASEINPLDRFALWYTGGNPPRRRASVRLIGEYLADGTTITADTTTGKLTAVGGGGTADGVITGLTLTTPNIANYLLRATATRSVGATLTSDINLRRPFRGEPPLTTTQYALGDVVWNPTESALFMFRAGSDGDAFTRIQTTGTGWDRLSPDGVVGSAAFAGRRLTMNRTVGASLTADLDPGAFDDRIAAYARATGPVGTIPDAQIPSGITRDSELPSAVDLSVSGQDLSISVTRPGRAALTDTVALPASGGTADGVVETAVFAARTLTLGRTVGADLTASLPDMAFDDRIATYARANPTGQILDAQIPASITRDSELPDSVDVSLSNRDLTVSVSRPGRLPISDMQALPVPTIDVSGDGGFSTTTDELRIIGTGVSLSGTNPTTVMVSGGGGGGTTVVANPGGSPADTLTTVTIGSTDYSLPAGGGGAGGTPTTIYPLTATTSGSAVVEITLSEAAADSAGQMWVVLTQLTTGSANFSAISLPADLLLDQTNTYSTAPSETAAGGVAMQIPVPGGVGWAHDALKLWRSDEADKLWLKASGRDQTRRVSIIRYPMGSAGGGGGMDGVVESVAFNDLQLRLTRSVGADLTANLAADSFDDRIATYARETPTGTIADAQIPSGVARDAELPDGVDLSLSGQDLSISVTRPGRLPLSDTVSLPASVVNAAGLIAAVSGTPTTTNNRIEWQTGGTLAWAPDSGGAGTVVTANPGGSPTDELTTVTIGTADYAVGHLLTKAEAEDETDDTKGAVTGELLANAINVHATAGHSITQVSYLPATEQDRVVYLTHDYHDGTREDLAVTWADVPGTSFEGWSDGSLYAAAGSLEAGRDAGCLIAMLGVDFGAGVVLNQFWSHNRACLADVDTIRIGSVNFSTGILLRSSLGSWVLTVEGVAAVTSSTIDVNLRRSDGTWLYEGSGVEVRAGLFEWNPDDNAYERLYAGAALQGLDFTGNNGIRAVTLTDGDTALFLDLQDLTTSNQAVVAGDRFAYADVSTGNDGTTTRAWEDILADSDSPSTGIVEAGGDLHWAPSNLAQALLDTSTDFLVFQDVSALQAPRRESVPDFLTSAAGNRLSYSNGQLHADVQSQSFAAGTDTDPIVANECLRANSAGNRITFFQCPAGTGDITAVLTPDDSGLAGGGETGSLSLVLDLSNLGAGGAFAGTDRLPYYDASASATVYESLDNFTDWLASATGGGISADGPLSMDIAGLSAGSNLNGSDLIGIANNSVAGNPSLRYTLGTLASFFADATTTTATVQGDISIANNVELPGSPTVEIPPALGNDSSRIATTAFVNDRVQDLTSADIADGTIELRDMDIPATPVTDLDTSYRILLSISNVPRTFGEITTTTFLNSIAGAGLTGMGHQLVVDVDTDQLADDAVTVAKLNIGAGSATATGNRIVGNINRYAFHPRYYASNTSCRLWTVANVASSTTTTAFRGETNSGGACGAATMHQVDWDYMTASDNPAIWCIVENSTGQCVTFWGAEDPLPGNATPIGLPTAEDGATLTGYTAVDVGVPTFSVMESVYSDVLTAMQRTAALQALHAYLTGRGWIPGTGYTGVTSLYTQVPTEYRPSFMQWGMRFAAASVGQGVGEFYMAELVVTGGAWARP